METQVAMVGCRRPGALRLLGVATLVSLCGGCADWTYEQIRMQQPVQVCQRLFPEGQSRRTESTLCSFEQGGGRTDVIVVLLTRDQRVCSKWQATHIEGLSGWPAPTRFLLRGELDPQLAGCAEAGPVDALRVVVDELTTVGPDAFTRQTHAWVTAGIARMLERWPHAGGQEPVGPALVEPLGRIPAGGEAQISVRRDGTYAFQYIFPPAR